MREYHCCGSAIPLLLFLAVCISLGLGQEPSDNNSPGEATQIQVGQAVQDSISKAGETDYFVLPWISRELFPFPWTQFLRI